MPDYEQVPDYEQETGEHYDNLLKAGLNSLVNNTNHLPVSNFFNEVGVEHKNIIDVGCGIGEIAKLAATKGQWNSYHGIDKGKLVVAEFNKMKLPKAVAKRASATKLTGQEDNSKDIVVCLFLLQDLKREDGLKALRELRRVAKHNADALIGLTINRLEVEEPKRYASPKVKAVVGDKWTFIWNLEEFKAILASEGFSIVSVEEVAGSSQKRPRLYVRTRVVKEPTG